MFGVVDDLFVVFQLCKGLYVCCWVWVIVVGVVCDFGKGEGCQMVGWVFKNFVNEFVFLFVCFEILDWFYFEFGCEDGGWYVDIDGGQFFCCNGEIQNVYGCFVVFFWKQCVNEVSIGYLGVEGLDGKEMIFWFREWSDGFVYFCQNLVCESMGIGLNGFLFVVQCEVY